MCLIVRNKLFLEQRKNIKICIDKCMHLKRYYFEGMVIFIMIHSSGQVLDLSLWVSHAMKMTFSIVHPLEFFHQFVIQMRHNAMSDSLCLICHFIRHKYGQFNRHCDINQVNSLASQMKDNNQLGLLQHM